MDLQITFKSNPFLVSLTPFNHTSPRPLLFNLPTKHRPKISRQKPTFRVMVSVNSNGPDGFSWQSLTRSIRRGSEWFWSDFCEPVKKETGFDLKEAKLGFGQILVSQCCGGTKVAAVWGDIGHRGQDLKPHLAQSLGPHGGSEEEIGREGDAGDGDDDARDGIRRLERGLTGASTIGEGFPNSKFFFLSGFNNESHRE
ncbi:hypothetical protein ACFX13_031351 [Malus domestica]